MAEEPEETELQKTDWIWMSRMGNISKRLPFIWKNKNCLCYRHWNLVFSLNVLFQFCLLNYHNTQVR